MAKAKNTIVFVKGKLYWPKIVGDRALHPNYEETGREWSYEFEPHDTSFLKEHKLLDRLKDKEDAKNPDKGEFLVLRKPEFNYEGKKNDPIRIYNSDGEPWSEDTLIGNGTEADVKLKIVDWGRGKKQSIYTLAIRIQDLVPYQSDEFAAMDNEGDEAEDEPKKKASRAKSSGGSKAKKEADKADYDDLDDDIPFD